MGVETVDAAFDGRITYHDACSGLRELGVKDQPRHLLASVAGLEVAEGRECETCCGFGGLFCVKYPEISGAMVQKKVDDVLWFHRVGDVAYIDKVYIPTVPNPRGEETYGIANDEPDCLADFERKLNAWGLRPQAESDSMREQQEKELLEATRRVLQEPKPDPSEIWDYVYADRNIVAED